LTQARLEILELTNLWPLDFGLNRNLETLILREGGKPEKPDLTKT